MKENTQEKNLIQKNENTIFGKIKNFFRKIFKKKEESIEEEKTNIIIEASEDSNEFKDNIKIIADEETKLLEFQRKYRRGEIAENDLTDEQIDALCKLYDKQIAEIQKTIEAKEQKIAEYRKRHNLNIEKKNA